MSEIYPIGTKLIWKTGWERPSLKCATIKRSLDGGNFLLLEWEWIDGRTLTQTTWQLEAIQTQLKRELSPLAQFVHNKLSSMGIKING